MDESKFEKREDGQLYCDGLPVDMEAVRAREAEDKLAAALAARSVRHGEVVMVAVRLVDVHDPQNLVGQVLGEGEDVHVRLSKRGLVMAEQLARDVIIGNRRPRRESEASPSAP